MPQDIRIWEIGEDSSLVELPKAQLNLEGRMEEWIEKDVSVISDDLLVIGRQIPTDFGGAIDLICLDRNGDLVIIELKRGKTPRDIVAQLLDYASWINDLADDRIVEIANTYFGKKASSESLDEAFAARFGQELPESLNENHRMLIIASELDGSTERVINYLSTYGIRINALTFHFFKKDKKEYLSRIFLIEPELADTRGKPGRIRRRTESELGEIAEGNGVGELYSKLADGLAPLFDGKGTTLSSIAFQGDEEGRRNAIFSLIPGESDVSQGVKFRVYLKRFSRFFNIPEDVAMSLLPANRKEWKYWKDAPPEYSGYEGFFKEEEIESFLTELRKRRKPV